MISTIQQQSEEGHTIAMRRAGSGPSLILLHGVGLRLEAWDNLVPYLSNSFSVIAIDLPGHGASAGLPKAAPILVDYTNRIALALRSVKHPALIVGHSMGALIALDLAIRCPELVSGVVALNCIFRRSPEAAAAVRRRAGEISSQHAPDPEPTLERWFGSNPQGELEGANALCRKWLEAVSPLEYGKAYRVFAEEDGPPENDLTRLRCPTLFITGDSEPNSTPAMSKALAEVAADGEYLVVQGARHMMPMTHAGQVAEAIIRFFNEKVSHHASA
jgi:pimeloyl-ACP methyl ester carboxylesterase